MSPDNLAEALAIAEELRRRKDQNKILQYYQDDGPLARHRYAKHLECFAAGKNVPFRCVMGANRTGKSEGIGAYETALHLTGEYPDWWEGHRFNRPVRALCTAKDTDQLRKSVQRKLFGKEWGQGMIPYRLLPREEARLWPGTAGVYLFAKVRHRLGWSELMFGTYDQGREAFEAFELDWFWEDEEPPMDVHGEIVIRTMKPEGLQQIESDARGLFTYTPLKGMTELTTSIVERASSGDASVHVTNITWDDVPHLSDEAKEIILNETPVYLRDARSKGIPVAGEGRIYQVEESRFVYDPGEMFRNGVPSHFRWVFGFDGGFYNTAVVWIAYDKDKDVAYVVSDYCDGGLTKDGTPIDYTLHAMRIKSRSEVLAGFLMPGCGDAAELDKQSGKSIAELYKSCGVRIELPNKAVEAGLSAVQGRLAQGKLLVSKHCDGWLKEYRQYSQEDGKPIKVNDHRMDATRYAVISGLALAKAKSVSVIEVPEMRFG